MILYLAKPSSEGEAFPLFLHIRLTSEKEMGVPMHVSSEIINEHDTHLSVTGLYTSVWTTSW